MSRVGYLAATGGSFGMRVKKTEFVFECRGICCAARRTMLALIPITWSFKSSAQNRNLVEFILVEFGRPYIRGLQRAIYPLCSCRVVTEIFEEMNVWVLPKRSQNMCLFP